MLKYLSLRGAELGLQSDEAISCKRLLRPQMTHLEPRKDKSRFA